MAQKLWVDKRQEGSDEIISTPKDQKPIVICDCCSEYIELVLGDIDN